MYIIYIMLLLINTASLFVECNRYHTDAKPSSEAEECETSCPELKDTDICSKNYHFLNQRAIEKVQVTIDDCNSAEPICCDDVRSSKYRTIDGSCNNMDYPYWGKAKTCLQRILPYDYGDGKSTPRLSCTGDELPNARTVSNVIHQQLKHKKEHTKEHHTLYSMTWGQMLSHDLSNNDVFRTKESGGSFSWKCCGPDPILSDKCVSYEVPEDDPFFLQYNQSCISTARTVPCQCKKSAERSHLNANTDFHDMSVVYGENEEKANSLRSNINGQLRVYEDLNTGPLLPTIYREQLCTSLNKTARCFTSGDSRAQQNFLLLVYHILMVKFHNEICCELKKINPHWKDKTLYQEARRILIAICQMITYNRYIKQILGPNIPKKYHLAVRPGYQCTEYDPNVDATVWDEFTTAAQRYGHAMIPNEILEIDPHTKKQNILPTSDIYFYPFGFYKGQYNLIATGMAKKAHKEHNVHLSDGVRNFLYRNRTADTPYGKDLAAISILRGREHGIPGYVYYLKRCHRYTAMSFKDLLKYIPCEKVLLFQKVYQSVFDIDLYSAGLAEYHVKGGMIGPTFACLVRRQLYKAKFGDRFYFEHRNQTGSFTKDQLLAIKNASLERIICNNAGVEYIQKDAFHLPSKENPVVSCDYFPKFNYECFRDTKKH